MFFKVLGSSNPTRLFVAGIHGDEETITRPIVEMMVKDIQITRGRLIVSLPRDCPYISTLNEAYYDSKNGIKLLDLIQEYKPGIYVELHTYKRDNHSNLTARTGEKRSASHHLLSLTKKFLLVLFHLLSARPNSGKKIFVLPWKYLTLILKRRLRLRFIS